MMYINFFDGMIFLLCLARTKVPMPLS